MIYLKHLTVLLAISLGQSCSPRHKKIQIDPLNRELLSHKLNPDEVGCTINSDMLEEPMGIENEKNYCYIISMLQALAPVKSLYYSFEKEKGKDPVAEQMYICLTKLRTGKRVTKDDINKLVTTFGEQGWLQEHNKSRKKDEPRDPSYLIKFIVRRFSSKYLKLMSIINEGDNISKTYCFDEGDNYDDIKISCSLNNFVMTDPDIIVQVSVYDDKNLNKSLTQKSLILTIPKEHSHSSKDLNYVAISFIHVSPNSMGSNHATAYVYRRNKLGKKNWYYANDSSVQNLSANRSNIDSFIQGKLNQEYTLIVIYEKVC